MIIELILLFLAVLFGTFPTAPNKQKQALELLAGGLYKTNVNCFKYINLANSH